MMEQLKIGWVAIEKKKLSIEWDGEESGAWFTVMSPVKIRFSQYGSMRKVLPCSYHYLWKKGKAFLEVTKEGEGLI